MDTDGHRFSERLAPRLVRTSNAVLSSVTPARRRIGNSTSLSVSICVHLWFRFLPYDPLKLGSWVRVLVDLFVKTVTEFIQNLESTADDSVGFLLEQESRTLAAG